jgi:phosphinothricin acetyltransferase
MIRKVNLKDASQIQEIYNYYILNSIVNFEENPVSIDKMKEIITDISSKFLWIIYEENKKILGYAYATYWKGRSGYLHSAETTIYLKHGESKKGIGTILYKELISQLKKLDFHALIGGIALPNDASIALHKKLEFEKVAHFKEVGFKFNKWLDVEYWELRINNH